MPLQKNQVLTLTIERLSNDGSGVAHSPDGEAVFIPGTAPGDVAAIRIVKDCGRYAFGILDAIQTPSPDRIPVDVQWPAPAVAAACGIWIMPLNCAPRVKALPMLSAALAGWMYPCCRPSPSPRDRPLPQ